MNKKTKTLKVTSGLLSGIMVTTGISPLASINALEIKDISVLPNNNQINLEIIEKNSHTMQLIVTAKEEVEDAVVRFSIDGKKNYLYEYKKLEQGQIVTIEVDLDKGKESKILPVTGIERKLERFSSFILGHSIKGSIEYDKKVMDNNLVTSSNDKLDSESTNNNLKGVIEEINNNINKKVLDGNSQSSEEGKVKVPDNAPVVELPDANIPKENVTIPTFIVSNNSQQVLEPVIFEFINKADNSKITATSEMGMLSNIEVKKDQEYTVRLVSDKFMFNEITIVVDNEEGEPKLVGSGDTVIELQLSNKTTENLKDNRPTVNSNSIVVAVLKYNANFEGAEVRLIKWDSGIPNVVSSYMTNKEGIVEISNLEANSKYEVRMSSTQYKYDKDFVVFNTNEEGKILLTGLENNGNRVEFHAYSKQSTELEVANVNFLVINKETGLPEEGVQLTANTIHPKLGSYKNKYSDRNGNASFELEAGKIYTICAAKNAQFMYRFEPEEITISVDDKGKVTFVNNQDNVIKVTKDDRTHLKTDLVSKISEAEEYLANHQNLNNNLKVELETELNGAKAELAKEETIPYYVETFLKNISKTLEQLKEQNSPKINAFATDSVTVENDVREFSNKIFGKNLTKDVTILAKNNSEAISSDISLVEVSGEKGGTKDLKFQVAENNSTEDKVYKILADYGTVKKDSPKFTLVVKGKEALNEITVSDFSSRQKKVKNTGSALLATVTGDNLNTAAISFDVLKNGALVNDVTVNHQSANINTIDYIFSVPENNTSEEVNYEVKLKVNNKDVAKSINFSQLAATSNAVETGLEAIDAVFSNDLSTITMNFKEPIFNNKVDEVTLKNSIRIAKNLYTYNKLTDNDSISLVDNKLIVNLATPVLKEEAPLYKIKLLKNSVKNNNNVTNDEIVLLVKNAKVSEKPQINDYTIINPVLTNVGGNVVINVFGTNLDHEKGTRIKVIESDQIAENTDITNAISYAGKGDNIVATIPLPANTSTDTKSYKLVFINTEESIFNRYLQDGRNRGDRPVLSVLPAGKNVDEVTLSNATITSYATSSTGNINDELNLTHTVTAKGQNSKKTEARLYGTNLKEELTKVKIVDQNGVVWPIRTAKTKQSGSMPLMVLPGKNNEGTGIVGEGNFQVAEIILPSDIKEDMTYTYYFAVDGVNFDGKNKLTALVQKTGGSLIPEKRTLVVKYQDEQGNKLLDDKVINGYSWFHYELDKSEIENFTFKEVKDNVADEGQIGDEDKDIVLIYSAKDTVKLASEAEKEALRTAYNVKPTNVDNFAKADIDSQIVYSKARQDAKSILTKNDATQEEVLATTAKIIEAREAVILSGKKALANEVVDSSNAVNKEEIKVKISEATSVSEVDNALSQLREVDNNVEDTNTDSPATIEDIEKLRAVAVKLSAIPNYSLADQDFITQYNNIRKEAVRLMAEPNVTKSQIAAKIQEVEAAKNRLLENIASK